MRAPLSLLAAAVAVTLSGCGADDAAKDAAGKIKDTLDPVAAAAAKTSNAGAARFTLSGKFTLGGRAVPLKGSGTVDSRRSLGELEMSFDAPPLGKLQVRQIIAGTKVYMRSEQLSALLPDGKRWLVMDTKRNAADLGLDALVSQNIDPTDALEFLRAAGEVKAAGEERIRGIATKKYAAKVDLRKVVGRASKGAKRSKLEGLARQMGSAIPIEVWIDGDDLVRRVHLTMGKAAEKVEIRIDMLDYGRKLDVDVPDRADTLDLMDLESALSGQAG